ncbi:MAG: SDR family oxidoreductase [Blastocatellia bacterium]|nr:SDR family oxidoreductase [Blastocatellia bacterium]
MRFQNQVVWITGASSGIGEALAYAFSREGAKLILSGRREAELERVRAGCASPDNARALPLDLQQLDALPAKAAAAEALFGRIDILVNNGGISQRSRGVESTMAVERAVMDTNYFGTLALTKAVLPAMLARKSGQIVVVSSLAGYLSTPMRSAYAASKHALQGWFNSLRAEVHPDGIAVTMICPGFVRTNISENALAADGSKHGKLDNYIARGMSAEKCAEKTLNAVARRKDEALIGGWEVMGVYLKRFAPWLYTQVIRRIRTF